ncbi:MAG: hypothetical protein HMLKMBBP_00453 [Planctomycetes bacterium]|nr:hypothetical protein [Planctomycetota bacterium]
MSGDSSPEETVRDRAPRWADAEARYLVRPDPRKNLVVALARGGERFVLKVYSDTLSYRWHTLSNTLLARLDAAYCLRGRGAQRADAEVRGASAFAAHGFRAVEVVERCGPAAVVFRWLDGVPVRDRAEALGEPESAALVRRVAEDIARRQAAALASGDRALLHPHPRLTHCMESPDGALAWLDFEGIVNPRLPMEQALGLEAESFLSFLCRTRATAKDAILRAALDGLGAPALARVRGLRRGTLWFLSGSARHRRERLARLGL